MQMTVHSRPDSKIKWNLDVIFSDLFAEEVDKCDYKLNKKEYGCIFFEKQSLDEYYACNVQNVDRRVIWKVFLIQVAKTIFIFDGWKYII